MKFLIIQVYQTNPFKEGQGGGVRYVRNLLRGIQSSVREVLFLGLGKKEQQKHIKLIPITKEITGYIKFLFMLMIKLLFINLSKYDIVHVHRLYFAIPFIFLKPKLKIVCSLHGRTFSVFESNNGSLKLKLIKPFFMIIERFAIKHIDYLIPVSQDVVNSFEIKYPNFTNNNIEIIGSMLDLSKFSILESKYLQDKFSPTNKYILFVGRLSDVKDINFLINLWHEKFQDKKNVKLVIAGNGEDREKLLKLSEKICVENYPLFLGEINPSQVSKLISSSNIVILASKHEASPTIIKESLSSGIPVITNNVGDVKDFIKDGKNGYIVNKDCNSYSHAITKLLTDPLSKDEVLEYSYKALETCSIEYVSNEYLKIYKKVIND